MSPAPTALRDNPYLVQIFGEAGWPGVRIRPFSLKRLLLDRPDVAHVHFPHHLVNWEKPLGCPFDMITVLSSLWLARRLGVAVVWTGHDLGPHEIARPRMGRFFWRLFITQVDLLISLSNGATELLRERYPRLVRVPVAVVPHGHYRQHYTALADPVLFRRQLGLDDRPVLLCFGLIRPYKNVPGLIRAWRQLPAPRPQLVVVGRPIDSALESEIQQAADGEQDVHLVLDYARDEDVPSVFATADVVVMPYAAGTALNSGAAHLSLSMGRPVVLTDTAVNRELQESFGPEWVWLSGSSPAAALQTALAAMATPRPALPELSELEPARLAALTEQAYAMAVEARAARRGGRAASSSQAGIS